MQNLRKAFSHYELHLCSGTMSIFASKSSEQLISSATVFAYMPETISITPRYIT